MQLKEKTYYNIFDYNNFFVDNDSVVNCQNPVFTTYKSYFEYEKSLTVRFSSSVQSHKGIKRVSAFEQLDGIFISLLLCFLLLVHVYRKGFLSFKENIQLAFSSRDDISMFSESTAREFWYNFLLIIQSAFLFSLILLIYFSETKTAVFQPQKIYVTLISFMLALLLFEGVKVLFYRFVAYLFDLQTGISVYLRTYMILIQVMGILLYLPVLLLIYFDYYHNIVIIFFFLLFIASRLIIIYRLSVFFLQKYVNPLYLIAYLCSVEIIPYILLYGGMVYLYENEIINLIWL